MIAEVPVFPIDARRHMCDGSYDGVPKEQVFKKMYMVLFRSLRKGDKFW